MGRLQFEMDGRRRSVELDDVVAWDGLDPTTLDAPEARRRLQSAAVAYVEAHPRPAPDAQGGVNVPARQRMALLRRLAAGPATRTELLAAMRAAAGYVGGDDWRNRMDELRGHGQRGGGHTPLPLVHDPATDTYRLTATFAELGPRAVAALGVAKAAVSALGEAGEAAREALDRLLPDVPAAPADAVGRAPADHR